MSKHSYCICGIDYAIMAFGFPEATTLTEILYFGFLTSHKVGANLFNTFLYIFNKTLQDQVQFALILNFDHKGIYFNVYVPKIVIVDTYYLKKKLC